MVRRLVPVLMAAAVATGFLGCEAGGEDDWVVLAEVVTTNGAGTQATVALLEDGIPVFDDSPTVTVNGTQLGWLFLFLGTVTPTVTQGDAVTLQVSGEKASVNQTMSMAAAAATLSATPGANYSLGLTWTAPSPTPPSIYVTVDGTHTLSGEEYEHELAGTSTSWTIPAGILKQGVSVTVQVGGGQTSSVSGAPSPSSFQVRNVVTASATTAP